MNKRLALAIYLALWGALAAGIVYGTVLAGYPAWIAVGFAFLFFLFANGSVAYRARSRQLRAEGKEPPPYLKYIFFPSGFPKLKGEEPRSTHVVVGIAAALMGLFLMFCGLGLAFAAQWSRIDSPVLAASLCLILIGVGALFLYFAWRCFRYRVATNAG